MHEKIVFSKSGFKVKVRNIGKHKMKLVVDLDKTQSEAFKNFMAIKPSNVTDSQFYLHIFLCGINAITADLKREFDKRGEELKNQAKQQLDGTLKTEEQDAD